MTAEAVELERSPLIARVRRRIAGPTLLALTERLINRGASALVTFAMAIFVSPHEAGAYAFGMLALTFATSVGSWALQQVGVALWRYRGGGAALIRISRIVAVFASLVVLGALVAGLLGGLYDVLIFQALLPLVLVAFVQAWFVPAITLRQFQGRWARLTRAQTIGSGLSLLVGLPLLAFCGVLAGVLQTAIAEGVFALAMLRRLPPPTPDRPPTAVLRRFVVPTAVTTVFGWTNGQADRLVVTLLAGAGPLGLFAMASAVAKTATDAVLNGVLNVLRFRLAAADTPEERAAAFTALFLRAGLIAFGLQIVVTALSMWPLHWLLSTEWRPALAVVPLLAMSGVAMSAQYTIAAAVVESGRARRLRASNVASLLLTASAGVLLAHSLPIGAIAETVADLVVLAIVYPLMAKELPRSAKMRLVVLLVLGVLFGIGAFLVISALG